MCHCYCSCLEPLKVCTALRSNNRFILCRANQLLEETQPWTTLKKGSQAEKAAAQVTLVAALEGTRIAAVLLSPVVPELSQRIHTQLGLESDVQVRIFCSLMIASCSHRPR